MDRTLRVVVRDGQCRAPPRHGRGASDARIGDATPGAPDQPASHRGSLARPGHVHPSAQASGSPAPFERASEDRSRVTRLTRQGHRVPRPPHLCLGQVGRSASPPDAARDSGSGRRRTRLPRPIRSPRAHHRSDRAQEGRLIPTMASADVGSIGTERSRGSHPSRGVRIRSVRVPRARRAPHRRHEHTSSRSTSC